MDTVTPLESPGAPAAPLNPDVPPSAPLGVADAQAKIDAIFADTSHPYHKGDPAAVAEMRALFLARTPGAVGDPRLDEPAQPVSLVVPGDLREEISDVMADDVAKTLHAVGLGSVTQAVFLFALGLGPAPSVPSGVRGRPREAGAASWQEREGPHAERQLNLAQDGVTVMDYVRTTRGRPSGELTKWLDQAGGVGNHPDLIALWSRIGGQLQQMPKYRPLMDAVAQARAGRR